MVVEPFAGDKVEDNLNPIGRVFYSASTFLCTPASKSQEVGLGAGSAGGRGSAEKGNCGGRVHAYRGGRRRRRSILCWRRSGERET